MQALQDLGVTSQMITSAVLTIIICIAAILVGRKMETLPGRAQAAAEIAVEKLDGFFSGIMGAHCLRKYYPVIFTLFIYVLVCNYSGLLPMAGHIYGLAAPTSSINFPMGIAIVVFFTTQYVGIKEAHGPRYYKFLFKPIAFIAPLMLIEQFVRPLSLTLRLYGNIFGEEAVTASFFQMVPLAVPVVMQFLSVLMGLVQALVFSLLSSIYISEAMETAETL